MHRETTRISDQFSRTLTGDSWHGDAIMTVLSNVTASQAIQHPIPNAHSIWELVLHMTVWAEAVRHRMRGEPGVVSSADDWRPVPEQPTDSAWTEAVAHLKRAHDALREDLAFFPDERLNDVSPEGVYSYYVLLHGVVQHSLYHTGQIALLKKAFA